MVFLNIFSKYCRSKIQGARNFCRNIRIESRLNRNVATTLTVLSVSSITIAQPLAEDIKHRLSVEQEKKDAALHAQELDVLNADRPIIQEPTAKPSTKRPYLSSAVDRETATLDVSSNSDLESTIHMINNLRFLHALRTTKYNPTRRRTIVVFVDGSHYSDAAFISALGFKREGDSLKVVHLIPNQTLISSSSASASAFEIDPSRSSDHDADTLSRKLNHPNSNVSEDYLLKHLQKYQSFVHQQQQMVVKNMHSENDCENAQRDAAKGVATTSRGCWNENTFNDVSFSVQVVPNINTASIDLISKWDADLAVVGNRDVGPLQKAIFGSFSSHLTANASCDVYIAKCKAVEHYSGGNDLSILTRPGTKVRSTYSAQDSWDERIVSQLRGIKSKYFGNTDIV